MINPVTERAVSAAWCHTNFCTTNTPPRSLTIIPGKIS